ncbi:hypothetical protein [Calothrix sp. CCY 0018]|uniref:2OG-Fe(II)-dependent halogenase WelO5 family protein n=1 Tax=Calothrix sp. CCY 0018 TaxID=3103864 RepID=UPI0039C5D6C1
MKIEALANKWLSFDVELASDYPDGIDQIIQGEIDGIVLKKAFSKAEMLEVKQKLQNELNEQEPVVYGTTLGCILMAADNDIERYFQSADRFREKLKRLFNKSFEARIEGILSKISGGRKVEVAKKNEQQNYTPATIRFVHPYLGGIGVHKNNDFIDKPYYNHLNKITKLVNALSYFVIIKKAEKGGDLVLYNLSDRQPMTLTKDLNLESYSKTYISPDIGDMVVFHGGNIVHQITDVKSDEPRITIGGFLAMSKDEQKILYWS